MGDFVPPAPSGEPPKSIPLLKGEDGWQLRHTGPAPLDYVTAAHAESARCIFCEQCGSIVDIPTYANEDVPCRMCGTKTPYSKFENLLIITQSEEFDLPPDLEMDDSASKQKTQARAVVKEPCPKCKHPELQYYTMQLRSADEGMTVFYECLKCGHNFSTNT